MFTRTSRKITPTERGKELYSRVAPLIEHLEETTRSLKAASLPTLNVIRMGTAPEFFSEKILPNLNKYRMHTIHYFGTASQLIEMLKEEQADLIVTSKKYVSPGIDYIKLYDEEFAIVAPEHLETPDMDQLPSIEDWLSSQNWISYGLELPIIRRFWRVHFRNRPLIKPVHVIPNLHMILKAIENGSGISLLPTYLLEQGNGRSKIICGHLRITNELFIAYQTKHKHLPEINKIITIIREER